MRFSPLHFFCVLSGGCSVFSTEKTAFSCSGHFVHVFDGSTNRGQDALDIELLNPQGHVYRIIHHLQYQRRENTVWGPTQMHTEQWTAILEGDQQILREQRGGKLISYSANGDTLYLGANPYLKIKP